MSTHAEKRVNFPSMACNFIKDLLHAVSVVPQATSTIDSYDVAIQKCLFQGPVMVTSMLLVGELSFQTI